MEVNKFVNNNLAFPSSPLPTVAQRSEIDWKLFSSAQLINLNDAGKALRGTLKRLKWTTYCPRALCLFHILCWGTECWWCGVRLKRKSFVCKQNDTSRESLHCHVISWNMRECQESHDPLIFYFWTKRIRNQASLLKEELFLSIM